MSLKAIFSSNKTKTADWAKVERDATATLFAYYKTDPSKVSTILPRMLLMKDCTLTVHNDERNPKHMFGWQDVCAVFFHSHEKEWRQWLAALKANSDEPAQIFATQKFAEVLTSALRENVRLDRLAS